MLLFVSQLKPSAVSRFIVGPLMSVLSGQFSLSSNNLSLSLSNSKWYSAMSCFCFVFFLDSAAFPR